MKRWSALIAVFSLVSAAHADVVVGSFDPISTARVFAPTAQGDVAPIRTVGGPLTQLQNATSFALDGTRSELYIGDFAGQAIRVFDVRASGDRAATRTITVRNQGPGLLNLKGHRSVGGMRASIYNATGLDAVEALVAYMAEFEKEHG